MKTNKFILLLTLLLLIPAPAAFAEDWFPEVKNAEFKIADTTLANYFSTNATYVSGNDNINIYYLAHVEKVYTREDFSLKPEQYNVNWNAEQNKTQFMIIQYKGQWFYHEFSFHSSYMNFNILNLDYSPVIELKYENKYSDGARAVVFYNGQGFSIRSSESNCRYNDTLETRRFFTYYYTLQGKPYQITSTIVPYIEREITTDKILHFDDYNRFSLTVNDDRVRLRTSNSLNSTTIRYMNKEDILTFILLDPEPQVIGGTTGYWILVRTDRPETLNQEMGWIFSPYVDGLSFGYSEK